MSQQSLPFEICLIDAGIISLVSLELPVNLVYLNVHCNQIKKIEGLSHLTGLKHLDLSSNEISTITGLTQCEQLQTLNLASNCITKVTDVENLRSLKTLNLSYNQITDISGLKNFTKGTYNLQHVELQGNKISSVNHITRTLISSTSITALYLNKDSSTNPVCSLSSYKPNIWSQLPWLHYLDGFDKQNNKINEEDEFMRDVIPGLDEYLELLHLSSTNMSTTSMFSESSAQSVVSSENVITPKIDAVIENFKRYIDSGHSTDKENEQEESLKVETPKNLKFDENSQVDGRLQSLENQLAILLDLCMKQQAMQYNLKDISLHSHESSTDMKASCNKERKVLQEKKSTRCITNKSRDVKLQNNAMSVIGSKKMISNDAKHVRSAKDDETYLSLMQELDVERERRWKAEQATRRLLDSIKISQERSIEDRKIQEAAIKSSTKLKQALETELNVRRKNEESIKTLQTENIAYKDKITILEKSELESKQSIKEFQEINMKIEKEKFEQDIHYKKRLKELQLDTGGTQRELEMLKDSREKLNIQIQQLQELLISREQEHKTKLQNMVHFESTEMRELIEKETTKCETQNQEVMKQTRQRLNERNIEYAALEDEFRMALQIEAKRYNELFDRFNESSKELEQLKTCFEDLSHNEAKAKSLVTELSTLVKEQKSKITEMLKSKQELQHHYKERLMKLEEELIHLRKSSSKVESLSQDKERMAAHIKGQESVIHGLRSERKLWGQELAQQGASLAHERGQLDIQLGTQKRDITDLKKKITDCNDSLKIKCKLVDDQTETIRKMKEELTHVSSENKRLYEDEKQERTYLTEELEQTKQANQVMQDEIEELKERKEKLKDDLDNTQQQLVKSNKEHKKLHCQWEERSKLIDVLEQKVINMKKNFDEKEEILKKEKNEVQANLKNISDEFRSCEEKHRVELSTTQHDYELQIRKIISCKDDELQKAKEQMNKIEDEMREILSQSACQKKKLEKRVKQLTQAMQSIHLDLT